MTTFNWQGGTGNWNTPSGWDQNSVPTSVDDAVIAQSGTSTITINDSETVATVTLNSPSDTLAIGALGMAGGFLQATSIAIDAGTLTDIGGFTASQVTDDSLLDVVTNTTVDIDSTPLFLGGTLLVSGSFGLPGTLALQAGEVVTQSGANAVITSSNTGDAVVNQGLIEAGFGSGTMTIDPANFINQGTVAVSGGTLDVRSMVTTEAGTGTFDISNGGIADFTMSVDAGQTLAFTDATGTLQLNQPGSVAATISGFVPGDTIDLPGVTADSATWSSGTLTIATSGTTIATLSMPGNSSTQFAIAGDNAGGSMVTATCYSDGTHILTANGEVPIENLRPGDLVLTVSGRPQPIRWIGHRLVDFQSYPNPKRILPVRIAAHAFGPGRPNRDLLLSPGHAVFVEGVLIPIRHLINGSNVVQVGRQTITYYHIELPQHDVLLADGMPAESYLESGSRNAFSNDNDVLQLHPYFARPQDYCATLWEQYGYAPMVITGPALECARALLRPAGDPARGG